MIQNGKFMCGFLKINVTIVTLNIFSEPSKLVGVVLACQMVI